MLALWFLDSNCKLDDLGELGDLMWVDHIFFLVLFNMLLIKARDVCFFHAVVAHMLGLLQYCPRHCGALRCWQCLFLSPCCCFFFLSPPPISLLPLSSDLRLHTLLSGAGTFGLAQFSSSTLTPFSTPPTPSPSNGSTSPKFGRDPLSYCLKEINKTVKPRISSFRTLRRSVSDKERIRVPGDLASCARASLCFCKDHWFP